MMHAGTRATTSAAALTLLLTALPAPAAVSPAWDVQYNASSPLYPEATGTGWTFNNNGTGF
jgi:hypothetical protein